MPPRGFSLAGGGKEKTAKCALTEWFVSLLTAKIIYICAEVDNRHKKNIIHAL